MVLEPLGSNIMAGKVYEGRSCRATNSKLGEQSGSTVTKFCPWIKPIKPDSDWCSSRVSSGLETKIPTVNRRRGVFIHRRSLSFHQEHSEKTWPGLALPSGALGQILDESLGWEGVKQPLLHSGQQNLEIW